MDYLQSLLFLRSKIWILFLLLFLGASGCFGFSDQSSVLTGKALVIQTLDLTTQRESEILRGNWLIRRKRLELLNQGFNKNPPFVVFFQNMLKRYDSDSDSDQNIFSGYGLRWHGFYGLEVATHKDTEEQELLGFFIRKSSKVEYVSGDNYWKINEDGYVAFYEFTLDGQKTKFFNIKMSKKGNVSDQLDFLSSRIRGVFSPHDICRHRIVIAGMFLGHKESLAYLNFLNNLGLVDTSIFCKEGQSCSGRYLNNEFAELLDKNGSNQHIFSDRILVDSHVRVHDSHAITHASKKLNDYLVAQYKMNYLHPSSRKGWSARVTFPACVKRPTK